MARVLIIDDDFAIIRALSEIMEKLGHDPIICSDGLDAIVLLEVRQPAAIIADWQLGEISGIEILEAAKTKAPAARRILITASPSAHEVREAFRSGIVQQIIEKPWSLVDIRVAVRGL